MYRLLIINPGSTSTKIAVYEDERQVLLKNISHTAEDLKKFTSVTDQYELRKELILGALKDVGFFPSDFAAVVARGGLLPPLRAGAYRVNDDMVWQLRYAPMHEHASNLGALIAYEIVKETGSPAFIYDAVGVDEMPPLTKITGLPGLERQGTGHNLNARAVAMRYAKEHDKSYKDCTLVVAHMGGGFSVSLHHKGTIIDVVNDEDGSFTPERAGALPMTPFIRMIFERGYDQKTLIAELKNKSGLVAHLGVNDLKQVEEKIAAGDERAKLVYEAMALGVAKNIAKEFPIVNGQVEAILLTGGIANSLLFTEMIKERLSYLAPIFIYAGENEMEALALGGLRVLRGAETAQDYKKVEK
jgi:butyrate kinase